MINLEIYLARIAILTIDPQPTEEGFIVIPFEMKKLELSEGA